VRGDQITGEGSSVLWGSQQTARGGRIWRRRATSSSPSLHSLVNRNHTNFNENLKSQAFTSRERAFGTSFSPNSTLEPGLNGYVL
jgi:hypothetical protein